MTPNAAILAVFDHTQSIAAADVDGDGDLDLLLGNSGNPSQVLLNAGDGTFPSSIVLPGGSVGTRSIAAADVDGDGDFDLLLGNDGSPSQVLFNAGDGTFPTSIELPGGRAFTTSIAAADVDGDGDLDVLLGNYGDPSQVLLNAGNGTFPTSMDLPGGSAFTTSIAAADVDGDGDLDVLLGNDGATTQSKGLKPSRVLLNAGDGTFPTSIELPGSTQKTSSIAAADMDGDGDLDVLLGNDGGVSRVMHNSNYVASRMSIELPAKSDNTLSIAAADVDGDGDLDVLLGNYGEPSRVLFNAGDGTFPTSIELPSGNAATWSIAAADMDGDGDLDVLLGNYDGKPSRVLLNAGDGTFPTSMELSGGGAITSSIAAADVDGDGDLDLLLVNYGSPSRVLFNAGDGTFPTSIELPGPILSSSIAAADVDGDGDLDLLLGSYRNPSQVLLNAGNGTFPTSMDLPGGSAFTISIAAADVDGDGDLDVLLGNYGEANYPGTKPSRVLLNAGDGTFPTIIALPGGITLTWSIAAADVDGDGDLDVLLGNYGEPSRVLFNAGDGTFPTSMELPGGGAFTRSIAVADMDADGNLDVLLGNSGSPSRLLPFIRCSQPGTARSRFGSACVRCPAPSSRRDDDFDVCYECEEHKEVDGRGECSFCKPGYDRSVGGAECTACPRGKRQGKAGTPCVDCSPGTYGKNEGLFGPKCSDCEQGSFCPPGAAVPVQCHEGSSSSATDLERDDQCAPLTPTARIDSTATSSGMMVQPLEVAALASGVVLLLALLVAKAWRQWRPRHTRKLTHPSGNNSVSLNEVSLWATQLRGRLSGSASPATVRSEEPTQLEVVDFSTLTMGRPIGQGGFATVWTARWQGNNLAVKVLNMEQDTIDESAAHQEIAILQEVAILRRLRHPCICALFGHMRVDKRPALVLEYMAGGSLAAYLFNKSRLPPGEGVQASASGINAAWGHLMSVLRSASAPVASQASLGRQLMDPLPRPLLHPSLDDKKMCFALQLASGLCFLHSHGILHHDIKTDNALLDAHYTVCKLADFGLASLSLNYARHTSTNTVAGTLRYLAPEKVEESPRHALVSGDSSDGHGGSSVSLSLGRALVRLEDRADVYAFGLLLWELMHERRAFEGLEGIAAFLGACDGLRPQFSEACQSDLMIQALTAECWAQRPEDRPSMSTVLERLEACMQALFGWDPFSHNLSLLQPMDSSMGQHSSPREQGTSDSAQRGEYPSDRAEQS